ncbi:transmembrane protein 132C isoform X2 [Toxorhynchites rutilus septentrionalis]|uniref:transmembrane protein 132C isoform X2 n=1 Tax=Toxorhynchites rutilus septentrionalis TaxID=329112 RepID=UPI00247844EF|nr:transmembrane protein 132C isoform X2 [Toxorhynchites rutilus septentrionalis]
MDFRITLLLIIGTAFAVEVHFETPDSGFFLKHSPRQSSVSSSSSKGRPSIDSVLSIDRFTVVQTSQPVSIRASYGPFSTKQTVPARYIVPDVLESSSDSTQNTTAALMDLQQSNLHLDISAHLVKNSIPRDSPVLRVLFHAGADPGGHLQRQKICVLLHASIGNKTPLKGRCMPEGEDGVCVAEVVIPANWWSPLPPPEKDGRPAAFQKSPQRMVQVSYSVFEPPARSPEMCEPKVQIQPLTPFAKVPLVQSQMTYKELRADETLTMMVPQQPLYPLSKIHVPVFLHPEPGQNVAVFIVRARVKAGMRILGASASSEEWNVSVEKENTKHTVARVTAFRKDQDPDSPVSTPEDVNANRVMEVFSWLLEVANDTKDHWDGGRIVWSVSYVHDGPIVKHLSAEVSTAPHEEGRKKIVAKLDIQKDDIQAVLPISKNWALMNTAVLTGRQVSQAMKVFIVSQSGKVADVTLQSSCQAEDESVIKVSSSCSSVYVDGSEARGSSNASVLVKYGTYTGLAKFTVWMPEFPLEVSVADFRLSQIKGWKIPDDHNASANSKMRRKKRAYSWGHAGVDFANGVSSERSVCRARYQQSPVEVYARFLATDQDSGRISYLISRRTGLRVTDLVQPLLRVADPKIATLRGRTLQGRAMGRTDVQVLSPITGRVIGAREVRVGSDKVSINRLLVRVVSGLQLSITSDNAIENGYIAETSVTRKLTAQYQEGLLDIDLEFSDGSRTPLRDISVDDYFLLVESLDTDVVAFAPMLASHHPRVIAVGEGNGNLLTVTLLLSEECRLRRNIPVAKQVGPLVSAVASVQVDFSSVDVGTRPDTVQNDGIPLKDDNSQEPVALQPSRQHRGGIPGYTNNKSMVYADANSLEIGMYVLLAAFCLAIGVFVISCVVYASKFRPVSIDVTGEASVRDGMGNASVLGGKGTESTTNAHDWVWLGRATVDRSTNGHELGGNNRDSRMHIINNPMSSKYGDAEESIVQVNSFDNPNHIQLPSSTVGEPNGAVNTCTYVKRERRSRILNENDKAPPLPPHGVPVVDGIDYRPPVPPHRSMGVTANPITRPQEPMIQMRNPRPRLHPRYARNSSGNCSATNPAFEIQLHGNPSQRNLNFTQQQINAALFNNSVPQYSVQPIVRPTTKSPHAFENMGFSVASQQPMAGPSSKRNTDDLHMAERLVQQCAQKSAFKFDTINNQSNSRSPPTVVVLGNSNPVAGCSIRECSPIRVETTAEISPMPVAEKRRSHGEECAHEAKTLDSNSDDNGGFVTPPNEQPQKQQIKSKIPAPPQPLKHSKPTVVGNPMFANTPDSELGPGESLGLDDLDMDYEQIMHYFDNLKESNA